MNSFYLKSLSRRMFCNKPKSVLSIFDGKFDDLKRNNKRPPKKESLSLYRDVIKACKKFFWRNKDGREWSEILLKSARKEFEEARDLTDSVEIGKKLVLGRQAIIEVEEKMNKVYHEISSFAQKTKNPQ